jgi:hypothetical protein
VCENIKFMLIQPSTSKIQMFKYKNKSHKIIFIKKIHLSQIFHHYKSHFTNKLFRKLKDFFESFLFIITNKHFTKHKLGTFNLQKQK